MKYKDYKKYQTVSEWWEEAGRGKFPVQVPAAISKLQKDRGLTFQEAFEFLIDKKVIILVDNEK